MPPPASLSSTAAGGGGGGRSSPSIAIKPAGPATRVRPSLSGTRTSMPPPTTSTTTAMRPAARTSFTAAQSKFAKPPMQQCAAPPSLTKRPMLRPAAAVRKTAEEVSSSGARAAAEESQSPPEMVEKEREKEEKEKEKEKEETERRQSSSAIARELEDLKAKLRVMEKKRAEDREKLKNLERLQAERDKFEGVIQKLQAKYQPQQVELNDLRKKLRETEARLEELEKQQAEHESILELATLDKEMAEEMAEAYKLEVSDLKARVEELQLEVEVLREENEELSSVMSPEDKSSAGWLQMEKTNERLREALIRLRDMTQQQEAELRAEIKELREDLEEYTQVKAQFEATKEKLLAAEANVDDLKQQLDTALGAEEMIEELADKNMRYQEEINELKAAIEDLEALREINDEIELNHVETEKQLQEELDYRESLYHEQCRRIAQQDEVIEDLEYTLTRFRELVSNLQADLEEMRATQQITETEANELSARSRAMMDLNRKLQASVEKAQVKTIDVELGRMAAEEASQHLAIVQLYLPEYYESEKNSVHALLRTKRVYFKATLIHNTMRERLSDSATVTQPENLFSCYEIVEQTQWITGICDRFLRYVTVSTPEQFGAFERALYELEPVERTLNTWIDSLKRNDIQEKKCAAELQRSIALLTHLAETLIPVELATYADELCMRAAMTQTYIDHVAATLARVRGLLQERLSRGKTEVTNSEVDGEKEEKKEDEIVEEEGVFFLNKSESLIGQARGQRVVITKVLRSLEELRSRSLALSGDAAGPFEKAEQTAQELATLGRRIGDSVTELLGEEGRTEPVTYAEALSRMGQAAELTARNLGVENEAGSDAMAVMSAGLRSLAGLLETLSGHAGDLTRTGEFERGTDSKAPWALRAAELRAKRTMPADADEQMRRLQRALSEASTALGVKDQTIEEQAMKVELLEARMRDATRKATQAKDLEQRFETLQEKEAAAQERAERLSKALQEAESERDELRARLERAAARRASTTMESAAVLTTADGLVIDTATAEAAIRENDVLRREVARLQSAIRFLRSGAAPTTITTTTTPYSIQQTTDLRSWLDAPLTSSAGVVGSPANKSTAWREQARQARAAESKAVLSSLLKLAKETPITDLSSSRAAAAAAAVDKPSRRPTRPGKKDAKETTYRYQALRLREQYEEWAEWKREVVDGVAIYSLT